MGLLMISLMLVASNAASTDMVALRSQILIKTDAFALTQYDLYMYLKPDLDPQTGEIVWGDQNRVREGLQQLYALSVLRADAFDSVALSSEDAQWIADHELTMHVVKEYLSDQVEVEAALIDYESLGREYYLANSEEFMVPATRTIRTLLIKTQCMTEDAAREKLSTLMQDVKTPEEFEALVMAHTEDSAAKENAGLMRGVTPGQTVPAFDEAVFALKEVGEFSDVVLTKFGAHVIQLLDKQAPRQLSFESVKPKLVQALKEQEKSKILSTLRMEAREKRPPGLELNQEFLEAFIAQLPSSGA